MSDFLSRLAERSTGTPPALRPRVPSTFEPWPAVDPGSEMPTPAAPPSAAQPARAGAPPPVATARPTRELRSASVAPSRTAWPPTPADAPDGDDRPLEATTSRTHSPAPAPLAPALSAAATGPGADAPPRTVPAPASRHGAPDHSPEPAGPARQTRAAAASSRQARRQASAPPAPERAAPAAAPAPVAARAAAHAPRDEDAVAPSREAASPSADRPAGVVGRRRSGPASTPGRAGEGTLTVEVTIGRVEVRAAPAPPPHAARRPAPGPRVTLDEYLAERTQAGRR